MPVSPHFACRNPYPPSLSMLTFLWGLSLHRSCVCWCSPHILLCCIWKTWFSMLLSTGSVYYSLSAFKIFPELEDDGVFYSQALINMYIARLMLIWHQINYNISLLVIMSPLLKCAAMDGLHSNGNKTQDFLPVKQIWTELKPHIMHS